jgi:hypothetical protein
VLPDSCSSDFLIGDLPRFTSNPAEVIVGNQAVIKRVRNEEVVLNRRDARTMESIPLPKEVNEVGIDPWPIVLLEISRSNSKATG